MKVWAGLRKWIVGHFGVNVFLGYYRFWAGSAPGRRREVKMPTKFPVAHADQTGVRLQIFAVVHNTVVCIGLCVLGLTGCVYGCVLGLTKPSA